MDAVRKHIDWLPAIIIAGILLMTIPSKFGGAAMTDAIFRQVGQALGLGFFESIGAYLVGTAELVAGILVLIPATRAYGAVLALAVMTGAIFFHLFTRLGMVVSYCSTGAPLAQCGENGGQVMQDGGLFYMAILVFVSALYLTLKHRQKLPIIGGQ
ncbi:hypothetical protein [Yunchengibacter salinarum]|uniref:hypothetical protein n=1 Tax=Yunchengibacter salinarum TaxID=3133399 RepID=UPI0035B5B255